MTARERTGRRTAVIHLFAGWTVFVWATRVENLLGDDGSVAALVVAGGMVLSGLGVAAATVSRRAVGQVVTAAAAATVVVWLIRAPLIVADADHGTAFKAVHSALALVSVVLALLALRRARALAPSAVPAGRRGPG